MSGRLGRRGPRRDLIPTPVDPVVRGQLRDLRRARRAGSRAVWSQCLVELAVAWLLVAAAVVSVVVGVVVAGLLR